MWFLVKSLHIAVFEQGPSVQQQLLPGPMLVAGLLSDCSPVRDSVALMHTNVSPQPAIYYLLFYLLLSSSSPLSLLLLDFVVYFCWHNCSFLSLFKLCLDIICCNRLSISSYLNILSCCGWLIDRLIDWLIFWIDSVLLDKINFLFRLIRKLFTFLEKFKSLSSRIQTFELHFLFTEDLFLRMVPQVCQCLHQYNI